MIIITKLSFLPCQLLLSVLLLLLLLLLLVVLLLLHCNDLVVSDELLLPAAVAGCAV